MKQEPVTPRLDGGPTPVTPAPARPAAPAKPKHRHFPDTLAVQEANKTDEQRQIDRQTLKTLQNEADKVLANLRAYKASLHIPPNETRDERKERLGKIAKAREAKRLGRKPVFAK